jgi:hypothetical protein
MRGLAVLLAMLAVLPVGHSAQNFGSNQRVFVTVAPLDPQQIPAGKPAVIDVHFRVAEGMHINSHKPAEEYLIPTTLTLATAPGVNWGAVEYPAGELRTFAFSSTEKLNVYTGDVTLHLHVNAQPGEHMASATLRYQACDNRACYPPKNVPVQIVIEAK